nr:hypothetical protein [Tanacetum cinerariifolium]
MCMSYTDVAQVANAACNYEILHVRDDDDAKRPDKRQKSGDQHQPTTQQSRHRNHGSQQSRGPSKGYSYPVCTTCGRRHLGECRQAAGTCSKCGQVGHLQKDCKKNTTASTSGQADKKPVSFTKRGVTIMMVNTRTDVDLSAAVQNALQTLLPQIRAEIREEFRTSSGPSDSGGNPPPVTIQTWLERFNKQKPRSFKKVRAPVDAENWISNMEKIFDVMGSYNQAKGGDAWLITVTWADFKKLFFLQFFPRAEQERLKREYHSIRQTNTETSTEFMQRFLRLAGFLGAAAGTEEEQAKNF